MAVRVVMREVDEIPGICFPFFLTYSGEVFAGVVFMEAE